MWDSICAKAMAKDRQNRYATASEFKNDLLTFMNGGVPMAAAFNPLTDLTNMKARKQAEMDANTVAMTPAGETAATQAFNPVTGQFEAVPNPQNGVSTKPARNSVPRPLRRVRRSRSSSAPWWAVWWRCWSFWVCSSC